MTYELPRKRQPIILSEERDTNIELQKETHKYYVAGEEQESSVTKYVNEKIFYERPSVNSNMRSARDLGVAVHLMIENHLNGNNNNIEESDSNTDVHVSSRTILFNNFLKIEKLFFHRHEIAAAEYMIYGKVGSILLCGTINALYWTNKDNREVMIVDWATSDLSKNRSVKKNINSVFHGKGAINDAQQKFCNLHCHKFILEKFYGVKVTCMVVVNLREDGSSIKLASDDWDCQTIY